MKNGNLYRIDTSNFRTDPDQIDFFKIYTTLVKILDKGLVLMPISVIYINFYCTWHGSEVSSVNVA